MAKKNGNKAQPVQEVSTEIPAAKEQENMNNVFTFVEWSKFGEAKYRRERGRGTVTIRKSLFATGEAPATISIEGATFSDPASNIRVPSPEKIAKLEARAKKAAERAAKAQEQLDKLNARLGRVPEPEAVASA